MNFHILALFQHNFIPFLHRCPFPGYPEEFWSWAVVALPDSQSDLHIVWVFTEHFWHGCGLDLSVLREGFGMAGRHLVEWREVLQPIPEEPAHNLQGHLQQAGIPQDHQCWHCRYCHILLCSESTTEHRDTASADSCTILQIVLISVLPHAGQKPGGWDRTSLLASGISSSFWASEPGFPVIYPRFLLKCSEMRVCLCLVLLR